MVELRAKDYYSTSEYSSSRGMAPQIVCISEFNWTVLEALAHDVQIPYELYSYLTLPICSELRAVGWAERAKSRAGRGSGSDIP